ncbi:MAG TPA: pitrilysin family protein, partial [Quisquiliibacterium sp.]|nr:pitrilysin family protein [Quisquiliibacterium sp.]
MNASFLSHLRARRPAARASMFALLAAWMLLSLWPGAARAVLPIEHWTTPSGARVYFVHAPSIPMLDLSISFDAGGRFSPADRVGLATLTNAMLAKGVPGLDEAAIAERFAAVGAQRGGGAGDDRATVSLRTLSSAAEMGSALAMLERLLAEPTFPAGVLEREKERVIQSLRESQTKPETIARNDFSAMLYPDHPYGRHATPETVAAVTREDLVSYHRAHYGASRAVVAMIGAVSRAQAEEIAQRLTARLPEGSPPPALPAVASLAQAAERRVEHPASQSHILIGAPAIAWGDPDQFPLLVGNYVLGGGGFVSR